MPEANHRNPRAFDTSTPTEMPRVADVMAHDVATCVRTDSLERAAHLMWERACGSLPVVDDYGQPIAMLTDRDICMAAYTQGERLAAIRVETAMSKRLVMSAADDALAEAERTMRRHGLRRLPVVGRDGRLVGLLSLSDIAAKGRFESPYRIDGLSVHAIAATTAGVGHIRRRSEED